MFDASGALLAICTAHAKASGEVLAKSRATGRTVTRSNEPALFRTVATTCAAPAAALESWF